MKVNAVLSDHQWNLDRKESALDDHLTRYRTLSEWAMSGSWYGTTSTVVTGVGCRVVVL